MKDRIFAVEGIMTVGQSVPPEQVPIREHDTREIRCLSDPAKKKRLLPF